MSEITETEAALYDRQIRLWGVDAQRRIASARVLLIGASGLNAEVCKNLVLGGIGHVTVLDNRTVTSTDLAAQFFFTEADIGKNRAQITAEKAQELNTLVKVLADSDSVDTKPEAFFTSFNVIVLSSGHKKDILKLDTICRKNRIFFFAGDALGYYGYFLSDMLEHDFIEEKPVDVKDTTAGTTTSKRSVVFPPLGDVFTTTWSSLPRRTNKLLFAVLAVLQMKEALGRDVDIDKQNDIDLLNRTKTELSAANGVAPTFLDDALLLDVVRGSGVELCAVCAVVGGILLQEVVKAVTGKDAPINNVFLFNAHESSGVVERVGGST